MKRILQILFFSFLSMLNSNAQKIFLVDDSYPGINGLDPARLAVFKNKLYYIGTDAEHGGELWEYDATGNPRMIYDIYPGPDGSYPQGFTEFKNKLYFMARDASHGSEMWEWDGMNPPSLLMDINPGISDSYADCFIVFKDKLYFAAEDDQHGDELWVYDGMNSPELVKDIFPGVNSSYPGQFPYGFVVYKDKLYFQAVEEISHQILLWEYDGVTDPVLSGITPSPSYWIRVFNDKLIFHGRSETIESGIWEYDGTNDPTLVFNKWSGFPSSLEQYNDVLYFQVYDDIYGNELWKYNGIDEPSIVKDINPGISSSQPDYLTEFNGKLYFCADDGIKGAELWVYDNINDPKLLKDINPGNSRSLPIMYIKFVECNNILYFTANDGIHGMELWGLCNESFSYISISECDFYISPSGKTWTESGLYLDTIPNSSGCDSIITIDLTILESSVSSLDEQRCESYTCPSGKIFNKTGIYLDTLINAAGCDSIITINLTILNTEAFLNPFVCKSYTSPSGNYTWTTSGIYIDRIPNAAGCDSIITIDLTILNSTSSTITPMACDSYISPSGNYTWITSGTYTDTIPNEAGCDSIITIDLTILNSTSSTITPVACDRYISPSENYIWTTSGIYTDTIPNEAGCDSIITIDLTILHSTSNTITPVACDSYISPSGNYTWITSGTYTDTIPNEAGCDSIIAIDLTFDCLYIDGIKPEYTINVFPNPTNGFFAVHLGEAYSNISILITNIDGQVLFHKEYENSDTIEVELYLDKGIYHIEILINNNYKKGLKLIKI
jgi:ELWxxDGT repeat protein